MKKHISMRNVIRFMAVAIVAAVTLTACDPERDNQKITFNSSLEQFTSDSKVVLIREQWIYWEEDDEIDIVSDQSGSEKALGTLVNTTGENPDPSVGQIIEDLDYDADFNGVFLTYLPWASKYFVGLHPHSDANVLSGTAGNAKGFTAKVNLPAEQTYRDDYSFDKQMFPMVAWYGGSWGDGDDNPFNLDFKSLAGLVRLQFFNSSSSAVTINTITVNANQPVSGLFNVADLYTDNPYLTDAGGSNTVTLNCNGLSVGAGEVKSLYLVMPAKTGETGTTTYNVTLNVDGKTATTAMKVRRNGITYMPALDLATGFSATSVGLVGNGTADRPFKIYRDADMEYLRSCFAQSTVKVNGVAVTNDTYFHIMRSDIVLPSTWTGINNFQGKMYYMAEGGDAQLQGITNNSGKPIFNSIANGATVEGVNVKCGGSISGSGNFSPFCSTNNGTIKNCNIYSTEAIAYSGNFAGICVTNAGTLEGCGNNASMTINGNIGGVCLNNQGTIIGCYAASPMKVNNPTANTYQVGGIAHTNSGTIKDSYFAARVVNSNMAWGGIVYTMSNGTVQHCYCGKTATIRTVELESAQNVGGIVNTLAGGTVDYCWTDATLQGGNYVGGIVATMTGGLVKRSFCNESGMVITALYANANVGGIVGNLNMGSTTDQNTGLQNCYVKINKVQASNSTAQVGGIVGYYQSGRIEGAYAYESATPAAQRKFYGSIESGATVNFFACYAVDATTAQSGVNISAKTTDNATISNMLMALNGGTVTGQWERKNAGSSSDLPVLKAYTPSSKRR